MKHNADNLDVPKVEKAQNILLNEYIARCVQVGACDMLSFVQKEKEKKREREFMLVYAQTVPGMAQKILAAAVPMERKMGVWGSGEAGSVHTLCPFMPLGCCTMCLLSFQSFIQVLPWLPPGHLHHGLILLFISWSHLWALRAGAAIMMLVLLPVRVNLF